MGKKRLIFTGVVRAGNWGMPATMRAEVEAVFMGDRIRMVIDVKGQPKSYEQLGFYWAGILPAIAYGFWQQGNPYSPHDKDDLHTIHEFMVEKYNTEQGNKFGGTLVDQHGEVHTTRGSTTAMGKPDMALYQDYCIRFAQEFLGVTVPASDDLGQQEEFAKELAAVPEFVPKF